MNSKYRGSTISESRWSVLFSQLNGISPGEDLIEFCHREELNSVGKWKVPSPVFFHIHGNSSHALKVHMFMSQSTREGGPQIMWF